MMLGDDGVERVDRAQEAHEDARVDARPQPHRREVGGRGVARQHGVDDTVEHHRHRADEDRPRLEEDAPRDRRVHCGMGYETTGTVKGHDRRMSVRPPPKFRASSAWAASVFSAAPPRYRPIRMTDPARSPPMAILNVRRARSVRRNRCAVAPKASHTKQQGRDARMNRAPKAMAWARAPPDAALR